MTPPVAAQVTAITREHFEWVLAGVCQLFRVPFDAGLAKQQFPPPYSIDVLISAAEALGFTLGDFRPRRKHLDKLEFPCVAFLNPTLNPKVSTPAGGESEPPASPPACPAILLAIKSGQILYYACGSAATATISADAFAQQFQPIVFLVKRVAHSGDLSGDQALVDDLLNRPKFGFRWFVPELLKHKRIWRDVLLASLAIQLMGLGTPLFTQVVIDKVVVHQTESTLLVIGVGMAMFMIFSTIMTWLRQYLVLHTGNRIDAVLGAQVFRHLFRLPLPYFEHRSTGVLVARLQGVETIRAFVSGAAVTLLLDCPFLFIFLAVMFWYSWQLSLIALAILGTIAILSLAVTPVFREKLNRQFLLGARNQAFVTEYVAGAETVKSLQMEPFLDRRYGDYLASYLAGSFSTRQVANSYNVVANALEQALTLAILVTGAYLVMRNDGFTIGMLVAFQMFASRMSQPMLRLVGLWQEFQQADVAIKRLGDVLDMPAEPYALTPARAPGGAGNIELQAVSFRYSEQHPFLYRNLNLTIQAGHLSVLMGPSGCGKSTLAKLLQGFYQPEEGQIRIDGRDIRHLSANELRQYFGVVPQDTVLFSGTIYDNLIMANPQAGFEDIIAACRQAEIHEVIEKLPQGYQTLIGEHGVGLSGGQKQRVAIARALLKRPKVLIFDEATSSLDAQTAEQFARTVNTLKGKVTLLFVTHALPRGLQVDEVFSFGPRPQQPPSTPKQMSVVEEEKARS